MNQCFNNSRIVLDPSKLPRHVAIIMDGNGRWAKSKGLPRIYGHKKGAEVAKKIIYKTKELGIPYLTLFAFSKENWLRPEEEIKTLLELLKSYLDAEFEEMKKGGIKFKVIGDKEDFPKDLQEKLELIEKTTEKNDKMVLCMALSYGGKNEIVKATRKLAEEVKKGKISPEDIDEKLFRNFLDTKDIPDPDLLIRTSGEMRISNFLLFQLAYTEFYFTSIYWPDFDENEYLKALYSYQQRERRFGRVYEF
ncbi:MAG: Undecaprenyl pyrophosphate synthase [Thermodesulfobacterium sp.]|uniref:Isoprenyl transferase n=1 Tax=Candidatus Thermodesulfobacterium syntrophicum TaxID=3060442 RepID=A0AAE3P3S3_9BACT|nr:Undecaprenyl pyrophosphate synthase [Candidatus Thermodesulfobacterium syntrophicum]